MGPRGHPEGINDEVRPWMTMSMPRGAESLTVDNVPIGTPIGRCLVATVRRAAVRLRPALYRRTRTGPGFHEESTMMSMRRGGTNAA